MASVRALGWTPVKGTRWLGSESLVIDPDGVVGDRVFSPVSPSLVCLKASAYPQLMAWTGNLGELADADGRRATVSYWGRPFDATVFDNAIAAELSELAGEPTLLARAQTRPGFIWDCPVSLLTSSELAGLKGPVERYRSNILVDDADDPVVLRAGTRVELGECVLELVRPIERCVVIDRDPITGAQLTPMLGRLGPAVTLGWGCRVVRGGRVEREPATT